MKSLWDLQNPSSIIGSFYGTDKLADMNDLSETANQKMRASINVQVLSISVLAFSVCYIKWICLGVQINFTVV